MEKKVEIIPASIPKVQKKVVIYARVSTAHGEQLESLFAQISGLTRYVSMVSSWRLVDIYIETQSAKAKSSRKEFARMLKDAESKSFDIVVTKNISRFGRDTVEVLESLRELRKLNIRVLFEQENLDSGEIDNELMISIIESIAQAENESRSENIKWGIQKSVASGKSNLMNRKCYGYDNDENGDLVINEEQAAVVKRVFNFYMGGMSVVGIIRKLQELGFKSPTGKERWSKGSIDNILTNRKYTGDVELLKEDENPGYYLVEDNNPVIISEEIFNAVQKLRKDRSNVVIDEYGNKTRSHKKYSSKKSAEFNEK